MQRDFWEPLKEHEEFKDVPGNISKLLLHARKQEYEIVHVRSVFKKDRSDWMLFYRPEGRGIIPCIEGTEGILFAEFAQPANGEMLITKTSFDAFKNTDLHEKFALMGVKTVLVAGIETSVCVLFTATSAYLNQIFPVLVIDACVDSPERHKTTLEMYGDLCFKTVTTRQLIEESEYLDKLIKVFT
jgi:nicotinamidase-related amidase